MGEAPFPFLRATFYRWAQLWPEVRADLAKAPRVLAVGDLHLENFGTWRDVEGRLIWGVNDFDEAYPMAYTNDLVRLAVSAHLAIAASHLALTTQAACKSILTGYREGLEEGGKPFVLEENHKWLREAVTGELRDPVHFWGKMNALPTVRGEIPKSARKALEELLPERGLIYRVAHRVAGLGSLGRERYVAIADWGGGRVAREAKAMGLRRVFGQMKVKARRRYFMRISSPKRRGFLTPSCICAAGGSCAGCPPIVPASNWPPCLRSEMSSGCSTPWVSRPQISTWGARTQSRPFGATWARRKPDWLHEAVHEMTKAVLKDWEEWKEKDDGK